MATRGHAIFAERLTRFAAETDLPGLDAVVDSASDQPTACVHGRPGVGRGSVACALRSAGVAVRDDGDVDVHVVAEVVKSEDEQALRTSERPVLLVLNKADLVTEARALCARYQLQTGVTTVPMVAHLADVAVDDAMLTKLRTNPEHLLETLDTCGIAHVLPAVHAGADAAAVKRVLRSRSGLDGVVAALAPLQTEAAYQRVRRACGALQVIAAAGDERVAAFLRDDATVIARMAAAVDVVEAAGIAVDPADDPRAHARRAAHWQRYRRGPVNRVFSACAADIVRGSLRLWQRAVA